MSENPYLAPQASALPPPLPRGERRPWNGWWTLLWAGLLFVVWQVVLTIGILVASLQDPSGKDLDSFEERLTSLSLDGDVIGLTTFAALFVICPLCWFLGQLRPGFTGWNYLGNQKIKWWHWPMWGLATVACGLLFDWLAPFLGIDEPDESMVTMARSTNVPLFLYLGVGIGAPLVEEFIFRGTLWRGWRSSAPGFAGTLVLTSFLWASLHVQYPLMIICYIFVLGLLLGWAREVTGNLWVPVWMHALNNGLATLSLFQL